MRKEVSSRFTVQARVNQPATPAFESAPGRAYGFSDTYLEKERRKLARIEGATVTRRQGAVIVRFQSR